MVLPIIDFSPLLGLKGDQNITVRASFIATESKKILKEGLFWKITRYVPTVPHQWHSTGVLELAMHVTTTRHPHYEQISPLISINYVLTYQHLYLKVSGHERLL
jgi:hypothetical protein